MKNFLDQTGGLWMQGKLIGKVGSVFTSSATQHGGQESTILSTHTVLLHHGMVIVGLPYAFQGQMGVKEVTGGSPYGASTIADGDGSRQPSAERAGGRPLPGPPRGDDRGQARGGVDTSDPDASRASGLRCRCRPPLPARDATPDQLADRIWLRTIG